LTTPATAGSSFVGSGWRTVVLSIRGLSALSTIWLSALACTSSPDLSSRVSVMSVRIRPNDAALVTSRVTPPAVTVQRYSLCV